MCMGIAIDFNILCVCFFLFDLPFFLSLGVAVWLVVLVCLLGKRQTMHVAIFWHEKCVIFWRCINTYKQDAAHLRFFPFKCQPFFTIFWFLTALCHSNLPCEIRVLAQRTTKRWNRRNGTKIANWLERDASPMIREGEGGTQRIMYN